MELTISQSGALYLAHRRTAQRRSEAFRNFAAAAKIRPTDVRRQRALTRGSHGFHPDNGR